MIAKLDTSAGTKYGSSLMISKKKLNLYYNVGIP